MNIIFILVDDLGWKDLGCYGSSYYETPRIDRLAQEGVRFTDAYSASPVCSPTRASILTGKYPARHGITQYIGGHAVGRLCDVPYFMFLPSQEYCWPRSFADAGYVTWHVGKWHLGGKESWPDKHGFHVNVGGCNWGHPLQGYYSPYGCPTLTDGPNGEYLTDRLTCEAIELLRTAGERPFVLNYWPYAVHVPIQAPQELVDEFNKKRERMGLGSRLEFEEGAPFPSWHKRDLHITRRVVQSDAAYAAMIKNLDWNIGRLLDEVEKLGKSGETIVIVSSDNGGLATAEGSPTCNAPLSEGKGWAFEGGVRVPLIVKWPGVAEAGRVDRSVVTSPDFYPTLMEMGRLPLRPEQHRDGKSFVPALEGKIKDRGAVFWFYPHYSNQGGEPVAAVREGQWKLVHFLDGRAPELFDLEGDISEATNVADREPQRVNIMSNDLQEWMRSCRCIMPERNPYDPFSDRQGNARPEDQISGSGGWV